ncbi:hypothetical protein LRH25_02740 [Ideonella azotifigens]|uniref:Uncharacterized protein n=1 Tax=Ideonella azotifigens TaxID=513160 RepID=A0ABP3VTY6_9BURK|nr:hypothetical protein [Ideonella azotifigens]MCD2339253.1 hypothetical protein [Ideonella azotifigens]
MRMLTSRRDLICALLGMLWLGSACAAKSSPGPLSSPAASGAASDASAPVLLNCGQQTGPRKPTVVVGTKQVQVQVSCAPPLLPPGAASAASQPGSPASAAASAPPGDAKPKDAKVDVPAVANAAPSTVRDQLLLIAGLVACLLCVAGLGCVLAALGLWPFLPSLPGNRLQASQAPPELRAPRNEGFSFRRHWGSFGSESTGWNLSPALMRLLIGLLLLCMGLWLLLGLLGGPGPSGLEPATPGPANKPASAASASAVASASAKG